VAQSGHAARISARVQTVWPVFYFVVDKHVERKPIRERVLGWAPLMLAPIKQNS
jgi:hypothetical protein